MTPSRRPPVDVVIATHDRPELVRSAVAAVVAQEYDGDLRCLVVHDRCAPDPALVSDAPGRRVEVLHNSRTPGLAGARNTGILAGRAPLVALCDDDDAWFPEKLALQVDELERSAATTVVSGIEVGYRDRRVVRVPHPADLTVARLARTRAMAAHPSTVLVRRAGLDVIGLVDEAIPGSFAEDYDWILRAAAVDPVAVVPLPLVHVRWGGSQFAREWATIVAAIDYLIAKHDAFSRDRRALGRLHGQRAFALAADRDRHALRAAARAVRTWPGERRAYLAAAVGLRVVSAERVLDLANRRGRGI